jgi:hypothetical protein
MAINSLIASFREDFPEFEDDDKYTDSMINFWVALGDKLLNIDRWGDLRTHGLMLWTAHNIALQSMNSSNLSSLQTPGVGFGIPTSQSAGPISESIDVGMALEEGGGNYNLTLYGSQFLRLSRIVGMGGAQI